MLWVLITTVAACGQLFEPIEAQSLAEAQIDGTVQVFIRDDCKSSFYGYFLSEADARKRPSYVPWSTSNAKAMVFKDPRNSLSFYVESDGRHVAAFDADGALLWVKNPYEDARLCPYRTPRPVIAHLEPRELTDGYAKRIGAIAGHIYVSIQFDSSQFGVIDESDGHFIWEGQN
jgi:hypothetical protein